MSTLPSAKHSPGRNTMITVRDNGAQRHHFMEKVTTHHPEHATWHPEGSELQEADQTSHFDYYLSINSCMLLYSLKAIFPMWS